MARVPWNKGKKLSDKHRLMLSISHIGKVSRPKQSSICSHCDIKYYKADGGSRKKDRKYCSESCYHKSQVGKRLPPRLDNRGPLNNMWKGGRSKNYKTGYYSTEYKHWRTDVFKRDEYTCRGCGVVSGYLTAHHIKSFAHYPELRFELTNGLTLCEPCHSKTDNYKGRGMKRSK